MNSFFVNNPARKFCSLLGIVLLISGLLTYQWSRYLRLQKQISATAAAINQADSVLGQHLAEFPRGLDEGRVRAGS